MFHPENVLKQQKKIIINWKIRLKFNVIDQFLFYTL